MQQVANAVAEILQRVSASVADLWPDFPARAVRERRGGEAEDQHQSGTECESAAAAGHFGIARDAWMSQG